jgi:hypothetical protein
MKLTGKVVRIESGDDYADKTERIMIRFVEGDGAYKDIRVPNSNPPYKLNDQLWIMVQLESAYSNEAPVFNSYAAKV